MFQFVLATALIASALADVSHVVGRPAGLSGYRPVQPVGPVGGPVVGILRHEQDIHPDGSYRYGYDTENGISVKEEAVSHNAGAGEVLKVAQGSYSYTSPEGEKVEIVYVADENGFQPQGSHIPKAHPAIIKALDYLATHPQPEENLRAPFRKF